MFAEFSSEEQNYLMNFWKPKVGDHIKESNGANHVIEKLEPGHEEQAHCSDTIVFLQDVDWEPDLESIIEIIGDQGGRVMPKFIRHGTCLFPRPSTCAEAIGILRTIRQLEMQK